VLGREPALRAARGRRPSSARAHDADLLHRLQGRFRRREDREGVAVLEAPVFRDLRESAKSRLDELKVQLSKRGGTVVEIELTKAEVKGGAGGDVTATVTYSVVVRGGLDAVCRQEASAWAVSRPGLAAAPGADAMQKALNKAVDKLGATIMDSCLYSPVAEAPKSASVAAKDPAALTIVIGVERYREGPASANFAESDARAVAEAAKGVLGTGDDRLVLLLGERATLADFQKYFERWLPAHAVPGSKVFVYFAGNGAPGYLLRTTPTRRISRRPLTLSSACTRRSGAFPRRDGRFRRLLHGLGGAQRSGEGRRRQGGERAARGDRDVRGPRVRPRQGRRSFHPQSPQGPQGARRKHEGRPTTWSSRR